MPLQSDSSGRGQENEKPRRYSLNDAHSDYGSDVPLSPSKSRPILQTHSLPKVLNGDDIPYENRRISRGSLYKDPTIETEMSGSNIQGYLDSGRRRSGPLRMDMSEILTPEKMLSDNPEFNLDPDVIIPPPPDFSGDARDYSSGELEMTNHISHQNSDQYRLEDLDVSADEVDLRSIMSTTHFGNSVYTQPPPSIGASLIDDVKVWYLLSLSNNVNNRLFFEIIIIFIIYSKKLFSCLLPLKIVFILPKVCLLLHEYVCTC